MAQSIDTEFYGMIANSFCLNLIAFIIEQNALNWGFLRPASSQFQIFGGS